MKTAQLETETRVTPYFDILWESLSPAHTAEIMKAAGKHLSWEFCETIALPVAFAEEIRPKVSTPACQRLLCDYLSLPEGSTVHIGGILKSDMVGALEAVFRKHGIANPTGQILVGGIATAKYHSIDKAIEGGFEEARADIRVGKAKVAEIMIDRRYMCDKGNYAAQARTTYRAPPVELLEKRNKTVKDLYRSIRNKHIENRVDHFFVP